MEFEEAERRLAKDQSKWRGSRLARQQQGRAALSSKAQREMELRQKRQEQLRLERVRRQQQQEYQQQYLRNCERKLGVVPLGTSIERSMLLLQPTSIHGDGDKIALPPSVLETLMNRNNEDRVSSSSATTTSPWMFRIGLLHPDYAFPASPAVNSLVPTLQSTSNENSMEVDENDDDSDHDDDTDELAFLEEMSYKYISYTFGTVVEFTQEEGYIGLPASIAAALLDPARRRPDDTTLVPVKRTVDPALAASSNEGQSQVDVEQMIDTTPGHLAWGAFDLPDMLLEVTLVQLPPGRQCTLAPTPTAIRNGFYALKDVKLVLEQSLIRTRATLSVGDVVHTWHRGVQFDLQVTNVTPSIFRAVRCINTDLEVDFAAAAEAATHNDSSSDTLSSGKILGSAPTVSSPSEPNIPSTTSVESSSNYQPLPLRPEPPLQQKEGVLTVQVQGKNGASGRRRLDLAEATLGDLFAFAANVVQCPMESFRLVTRFPRRVLEWSDERNATCLADNNAQKILTEFNFTPGQEMLFVELM